MREIKIVIASMLLIMTFMLTIGCKNESGNTDTSAETASLKAENDRLEAQIAKMEAEKEAASARAAAAAAKAEAEAAKAKATAQANSNASGNELSSSSKSSSSSSDEIYLSLWGTIGDAPAELYMDGRSGTFEYNGIHRIVKFKSYNRRTGKLILSEYDTKGNYIGQFVGTYTEEYIPEAGHVACSYDGEFTNTKGGKATFNLYAD